MWMSESTGMTAETIIRRSDAILATALGDKTVMMDVEQGLYYGLDEVGTRVWALTEKQITVQRLSEQLLDEYEVSPEQCVKGGAKVDHGGGGKLDHPAGGAAGLKAAVRAGWSGSPSAQSAASREGGLRTRRSRRGAGLSCCGRDDSSRRSAPGCGRDGSAGRAGRRSAVQSRRSPSIR